MKVSISANLLNDLRVAFPEHVLFQELQGEAVLLDLQQGQYYGLNALGTRVWNLLHDGKGVGEVIQTLLAEYDCTEEQIKADIAHFLNELYAKGLVQVDGTHSI